MGRALYRSYRPKKLSELMGQEHITAALARALEKGTIGHAYLFTGPRGTGKTSIARILAHEVNGLPYDDDATHLDIIEIDAASNRRIDEIRDLRDKVHIAPTSAKFKVYIIDEVHMLTKEAFNALLKTLEEPPAHVIFLLATTEVHKLPETIISRTQRFAFKPVDLGTVATHLKHIAKQEKITVADDALELIAAHGEGSFRDSISLLDQARSSGEKVTLADVQGLLGIAPDTLITEILAGVEAHDVTTVAQRLQALQGQGFEPAQVARQIAGVVREGVVTGRPSTFNALDLLAKLIEVPATHNPRAALEIALLDAALAGAPAVAPPAALQKTPEPKAPAKAAVETKPPVQIEPHPSAILRAAKTTNDKPLDPAIWPAVLDALKKQHNTLYSIVRATQPTFAGGALTLACAFAFHKKRLNEARNKQILIDTIQNISGQKIAIECVLAEKTLDKSAAPPLPPAREQIHATAPQKTADNPAVKTISNIFGGAELLES